MIKLIKLISKIFIFIFQKLHLFLTLILCLTYFILYFLQIEFAKTELFFNIIHILIVSSIFLAIYLTIRNSFLFKNKLFNKEKKSKNLKSETELVVENKTEEKRENKRQNKIKPVYYQMKNNPNYVFAEYEDRYEIFLNENGNLKYVRTDKKEGY